MRTARSEYEHPPTEPVEPVQVFVEPIQEMVEPVQANVEPIPVFVEMKQGACHETLYYQPLYQHTYSC